VPTTPEEWLPILAKRLDQEFPRIHKLRNYNNGNAPLPEMGKNVKASWQAFQKKARTNFGGLARDSLAMRIKPNAVRVGDSTTSDAAVTARRIWRDNRLSVQFADAIIDYLDTGKGYMVTGIAPDGTSVVTRERPEQFYAAPDPMRPWKALAGIKIWRDRIAKKDYALVWVAGQRQKFSRSSTNEYGSDYTTADGGWASDGEPELYEGAPPIAILERKDGEGLIEPHLDVIDRINEGKLQRLVTTAMQAFRQRALKTEKGSAGLERKDEDDNDIDYAKVFEPAPGALWDLPEGIDIWESQQTDIRPMLEGEKTDARDFAAATKTAISVFVPEGENQSAEGAANAKEAQILMAKDEIDRLEASLALVFVHALQAENVDLGGATVEVGFQPPEHVSLTERYAAAAQAKAAGLAQTTIRRDILGMTPDQIAQDDIDRAAEQLEAAILVAQAAPAAPLPVPVA